MINLTEFELKDIVTGFYKGHLTTQKAIKLYELEYGDKVNLIENISNFEVNTYLIEKENDPAITVEGLVYLKNLQTSGKTNMFSCTQYIEQSLGYSHDYARRLLKFYLKNYNSIYYPEKVF